MLLFSLLELIARMTSTAFHDEVDNQNDQKIDVSITNIRIAFAYARTKFINLSMIHPFIELNWMKSLAII